MKQVLSKYKITISLTLIYLITAYTLNAGLINAFGNTLLIICLLNSLAKLKNINSICKVFAYILTFITSLILTIDIFYFYHFKSRIPLGVFASIWETNVAEATSITNEYWLSFLIILTLTTTLNLLSIKELSLSKLKGYISFICIPTIYLVFLSAAYIRFKNTIDEIEHARNLMKRDISEQPILGLHYHYGGMFPLLVYDILTGITYIAEMSRLSDFNTTTKTLYDGVIFTDTTNIPNKIYLVIGESSYRNHYSLYGYNRPTTPFLKSLANQNDSSILYYKAIAPSSLTRDAIRLTLTFSTPKNFDAFFNNKSIIDMAKDCGYETVWLSNQEQSGLYDSYISFIATSSDKNVFIKDLSNKYKIDDDLNLVEELPNYYNPNKKQLIILHLMGSHYNYKDRYDNKDIMEVENNLSIDYDRSIHHTDRVLSNLYDFIQQHEESTLLYYYSDHGEIINLGHGQVDGIQQYEIPLLIINHNIAISPKSILDKYIDTQNGLINSLATINIIAEIMGYKISDELTRETINNGRYVSHVYQDIRLFKEIKPMKNSIQ
jgi:glucan phosphoethanolaminetransferase (alkaline phosphatase superfamily)